MNNSPFLGRGRGRGLVKRDDRCENIVNTYQMVQQKRPVETELVNQNQFDNEDWDDETNVSSKKSSFESSNNASPQQKPYESNYNRSSTYVRSNYEQDSYRNRDYSNRYNNRQQDTYDRDSGFDRARSRSEHNQASVEPKQVEHPRKLIDWDAIRAQPNQNMSKFKDHPPVVKDFYREAPEIAQLTYEQAQEIRLNNFNIKVELFKKDKAYSYALKPEELVDKSQDEIEAYLQANVANPVATFEQAFGHYPEIMSEIHKQNFEKPSPIQSQMWPILMKGHDVVGIAQTGTGKTLAFLLPAMIHIEGQTTPLDKRLGPNVLVLSPTRELAIQIHEEVKKINYKGMKSVCIYGGGDRKEQIDACGKGVQIIIGTPGRIYDLISNGMVNVTSVTYLVLDEADKMLDLGFEPQILKILLDIRPDRQTVMTSATWPEGVRRLATKYLTNPLQLYVGTLDLRAAKSVTQNLIFVESDEQRKETFMKFLKNFDFKNEKVIVFAGRKTTVDTLSTDLVLSDIKCEAIHGDREQIDREQALDDFKKGNVRILIATDVASRGIDVKDITCVFNYDFPRNIEEYVHRVGRTGRAGRTGQSITIMTRQDWKHAKELIEILASGNQIVPQNLKDMAERYECMLKKKVEERAAFGGGGIAFKHGAGSNGGAFGSRRYL